MRLKEQFTMESFITTLQSKYGFEAQPKYTRRFCMNAGVFGSDCDNCFRLCPEGIFTSGKTKTPDFTKCTKCGICSAVCPSFAVDPIALRVRTFIMALAKESEISIGCERDEDTWSVGVYCLAAVSWEQIALAALRGGVTLSLRKCAECDRKECCEHIIATLNRVKRFLGDDVFFDRVRILEEGDEYTPHGSEMSRRDILTFFMHLPLDTAMEMLPELGKNERGAQIYRAMLRDAVREKYDSLPKEERPRYIVSLPVINDSCYACEMCKRQCPEKALDFRKSAESDTFTVTIDAWKCTDCGGCVKACREKAVEGMGEMSLAHLGTVLIKRGKLIKCVECGRIIKPSAAAEDGLCDVCRAKHKREENKRKKESEEKGE